MLYPDGSSSDQSSALSWSLRNDEKVVKQQFNRFTVNFHGPLHWLLEQILITEHVWRWTGQKGKRREVCRMHNGKTPYIYHQATHKPISCYSKQQTFIATTYPWSNLIYPDMGYPWPYSERSDQPLEHNLFAIHNQWCVQGSVNEIAMASSSRFFSNISCLLSLPCTCLLQWYGSDFCREHNQKILRYNRLP